MPFVPFAKGNKAAVGHGRPKVAKAFKLKCRALVDEVVIGMWEKEVREQGEEWVRCSELLANYGYGKPAQPVTGDEDRTLGEELGLTADERRVASEALRTLTSTEDSGPATSH